MSKMKPFRTDYTFETPEEAIEFYQNEVGEMVGDGAAAFLSMVADYDEDAVFNVQPGVMTHYIAVARPQDRNAWAFIKPDKIVLRVGHPRNAEALTELFEEIERATPMTRGTWNDVEIALEHGGSDAADYALVFAAAHAAPREAVN